MKADAKAPSPAAYLEIGHRQLAAVMQNSAQASVPKLEAPSPRVKL